MGKEWLTREQVGEWLHESGTTARELAEWCGISGASLSMWLDNQHECAKETRAALTAAIRAARAHSVRDPAGAGALTVEAGEALTTEETQDIARCATGACVSLWRSIVMDAGAPVGMRMKAAEHLMGYAHGKPPKLQVEKKVKEAATDADLLAKLELIEKNTK